MNQTTVRHISDHDIFLIFKGAFFYLAPLTILLSVIVIIQNIIIFVDYYKDRKKLIPSLFMGIALSDMLRAQGELLLSVLSILVYTGVVEVGVLYKSLVYYMFTALPGQNWSKLCNLVMSISITFTVVNPFNRLNSRRIQKIMAFFCLVIVLLHFSDAITAVVVESRPNFTTYGNGSFIYLYLDFAFQVPGIVTTAALYCWPDNSGTSKCQHEEIHSGNHQALQIGILGTVAAIYFLVPPLVMFICMTTQVVYLKRSLQEEEGEEARPLVQIPNTSRHVTITVTFITLLFFFCTTTYIFFTLVWWLYYNYSHVEEKDLPDKVKADLSVLLGFTEFTLPLIYALLYPVILICRKEELRLRYAGYWRRLTASCTWWRY